MLSISACGILKWALLSTCKRSSAILLMFIMRMTSSNLRESVGFLVNTESNLASLMRYTFLTLFMSACICSSVRSVSQGDILLNFTGQETWILNLNHHALLCQFRIILHPSYYRCGITFTEAVVLKWRVVRFRIQGQEMFGCYQRSSGTSGLS